MSGSSKPAIQTPPDNVDRESFLNQLNQPDFMIAKPSGTSSMK